MGPSPLPRVPGGGRGLVSQCCSVGGALPLPALRCVRHRLQRGPRARGGRSRRRARSPLGRRARRPALSPPRAPGRGLEPRPEGAPPPPVKRRARLPSSPTSRCCAFSPRVLPQRPGSWAFVRGTQPSRHPPAAHTVLSSIHSVLVKARRALAEPSPRSPSSPAAPPPAPSRCGVDRWRFVRRARRG